MQSSLTRDRSVEPTPPSPLPIRRTRDVAVGLIACTLLVVLALWVLDRERRLVSSPLWYDEQWRAVRVSITHGFVAALRHSGAPIAAGWAGLTKLSVAAFGSREIPLRLPQIVSFVAMGVVMYLVARRFVSRTASVIASALLVLNIAAIDYLWQMAAYDLEMVAALLTFLVWLWARSEGRSTAGVWIGYALLAVFSTLFVPSVFVVAPLAGIDVLDAVRTRRLRTLAPACVAGAVALGHLVLWISPQTNHTLDLYWQAYYAPHGAGPALRFAGRQLLAFVPTALSGNASLRHAAPVAGSWFGPLAFGAVVVGLVVAAATKRGRPLALLVAGMVMLEFAASWKGKWPFGYTRVSNFMVPFVYLLGAYGVTELVRGARRLRLTVAARAVAIVGAIAVLAGSGVVAASLVRLGLDRIDGSIHGGVPFAAGIRSLVADARENAEPHDVAVLVHKMSWNGWNYYMETYEGYPHAIDGAPRIGVARTLYLESSPQGAAVATFLRSHPDARNVYLMVLMGTTGRTIGADRDALTAAGFRLVQGWSEVDTGLLERWTKPSAS